jgi:hypothetical protein
MQLMLELSSCGEALALPITQGAPPCLEHGKTCVKRELPSKVWGKKAKTQDLQDVQRKQKTVLGQSGLS